MAQHKTRLTGFTRFLLAIIFIVPLAYLGASYINGEDGIQNIKELVGLAEPSAKPAKDTKTIVPKAIEKETNDTPTEQVAKHTSNDEIKKLKAQIEELEKENERLEAIIRNRDRQIEDLQK